MNVNLEKIAKAIKAKAKKERGKAKQNIKNTVKIIKKVKLPEIVSKEIKDININLVQEFKKQKEQDILQTNKQEKTKNSCREFISKRLSDKKIKVVQLPITEKYCTNYVFTETGDTVTINNLNVAKQYFNPNYECEIISTGIYNSKSEQCYNIRIRENKWNKIEKISILDKSTYIENNFTLMTYANFNSSFPAYTDSNYTYDSEGMYENRAYQNWNLQFNRGRNVYNLIIKNFWFGGEDYSLEGEIVKPDCNSLIKLIDGRIACSESFWKDDHTILGSTASLYYRFRYAMDQMRNIESENIYTSGGDLWIRVWAVNDVLFFGGFETQGITLKTKKIIKVTGILNTVTTEI